MLYTHKILSSYKYFNLVESSDATKAGRTHSRYLTNSLNEKYQSIVALYDTEKMNVKKLTVKLRELSDELDEKSNIITMSESLTCALNEAIDSAQCTIKTDEEIILKLESTLKDEKNRSIRQFAKLEEKNQLLSNENLKLQTLIAETKITKSYDLQLAEAVKQNEIEQLYRHNIQTFTASHTLNEEKMAQVKFVMEKDNLSLSLPRRIFV